MSSDFFLEERAALNAICPYFTMFPLKFPLDILRRMANPGDRVLDPFCGRGTTNFAARMLGLESAGIDASPVAAAITAAKLVTATPEEVVAEAEAILSRKGCVPLPVGFFWERAYHPKVLEQLCKLRYSLSLNCRTDARKALRGVVLGALHGPQQKEFQSYFSNQCPRTYAPKPKYAVSYWKKHGLKAKNVDVLEIIARRSHRYFAEPLKTRGTAKRGDSRVTGTVLRAAADKKFDWIITSPPYYGMRTYMPDQWLRNWFVGGSDNVDYSTTKQLAHRSPERFSSDLSAVWKNATKVTRRSSKLVVRFGGIADRNVDPRDIVRSSLCETGWKINTIKPAGVASDGKRQADTFLTKRSHPIAEYVVWASRS